MEPITKLTVRKVPIDSVHEHPANARRGDVEAIKDSLTAHGQYAPIVVQQSTGHIVKGNHTRRGAAELGWAKIDAVFIDVDDDQALRILAVDNRSSDLSDYDDRSLAALLESLSGSLTGTGFDDDDLSDLLKQISADPRNEVAPFNPDPSSDDYYTPAWIFERLGLQFDLDVASPPEPIAWIPAKARFTVADDGLSQPWKGRVWMNPPYSKPTPWVTRWIAHRNGVALLPFAKSAWFEEVWQDADAITFPGVAASKFVGGYLSTGVPSGDGSDERSGDHQTRTYPLG